MLWRRKRKLGSRILRFGCRGSDVEELQDRLEALGYQIGQERGCFGYLTQESVCLFQKEHRLRRDGIAGPQVYSLLLADQLPVRRHFHVVEEGETLRTIAQRYGVSEEAIRETNRVNSVYPGMHLTFFDREVWGLLHYDSQSLQSAYDHQSSLTGVVVQCPLFSEQRFRRINLPTLVSITIPSEEDSMVFLHRALKGRRMRQQTLSFIEEKAKGRVGVYLPWTDLARTDGTRYVSLLKQLRARLPAEVRLLAALSRQMPNWNWLGGVSFSEVAQIVDQVVIPPPTLEAFQPLISKQKMEAHLFPLMKHVPNWKIVLTVPLFAARWEMEDESSPTLLPYDQAMAIVYRRGLRLQIDEQGDRFYAWQDGDRSFRLKVVGRAQLNQTMALLNRWNLSGVLLDSLGFEDQRIWPVLRNHFGTQKLLSD